MIERGNRSWKERGTDIFAGVIVALVSIPISMGYAQVSGLPVVYGLYGSLLPILIFGLLSTTRNFVFGVDAAPAALVGAALASMGIAAESQEAMWLVPLITLFTSAWLLCFYKIKAGRMVKYISMPVLGGFVTGICCTIILMQIPKLYGGTSGNGEIFGLIQHIWDSRTDFQLFSFLLGLLTLAVLLLAKKFLPRFPMPVVVMLAGIVLTRFAHVDDYGVRLLPTVKSGLPTFVMPHYAGDSLPHLLLLSLTIATVIVAETLLSSRSYAMKDGDRVDENREILVYALCNLAAALTGCCPVNGSVSRTGLSRQFGCKSQLMSFTAAATMALVLLFGTPLIAYMPVPVLTAIVISALLGACEFDLLGKLKKASRTEYLIFLAAFAGVLLFGTIYGVAIGVVLSFVAVLIRAVTPPREFVGVIPGQEDFYALDRSKAARPIRETILYRFGGNLFFANIDTFQKDLEDAVKPDTRQIIVNASGIGNIDITAADRLMMMNRNFRKRGIRFYLVEHVGAVNDQLRTYGAAELLTSGAVRRTVSLALRSAGLRRPYPLEPLQEPAEQSLSKQQTTQQTTQADGKLPALQPDGQPSAAQSGGESANVTAQMEEVTETNEMLAELEWAFGAEAGEVKEKLTQEIAQNIAATGDLKVEDIIAAESNVGWGRVGLFDEDELLDRLEMHLSEMSQRSHMSEKEIEDRIEQRRAVIERKLHELNPESLKLLRKHRLEVAEHFREINPKAYRHMVERREEHIRRLEKLDPELAEKMRILYDMTGETDEHTEH